MPVEVIRTIPEKCVQCYACVRNCPVKAVAIKNGKAQVIQERCIQCGNCVKICSQGAKEVLSGIEATLEIIDKGNSVALLAPSFPAAFPDKIKLMAAALRRIGFSQVWEVAVGAEMVVQACQKMNFDTGHWISSSCPAVINLIERHYPQFIKSLIPVVSPAIATARLIRYLNPKQDFEMVFIGPCIAKKGEIRQPAVEGEIQEAITYSELEEMLNFKGVDWAQLEQEGFDSPTASLAYTFPMSGGLLRNMNRTNDLLREDYLVVDGMENWRDVLEIMDANDCPVRLVDGLFCNGCIDGPAMNQRGNAMARKSALLQYVRSIPYKDQAQGKNKLMALDLDLSRGFQNLKVSLPQPSEDEIADILRQTGKLRPEDQMNCGACGYSSCREKAIAIFQGIAEVDMCLPYLLAQKNELVKSLDEELKRIRDLKEEMDILIDASYDGIAMTDGQGNIQRVNKTMQQLLGMSDEKLIGKNMGDLEKAGLIYPSATMMVLRAKKAVTFLQQLRSGKRVLATGNPVLDENGNVTRVISNVRDFDQLQKIREELDSVHCHPKVEKLDRDFPVIALSESFNRVLEMAARVAIVDSTVLILGESGVGKEIVARYIHKNSPRAEGPLVKINCGALPESLIESELFGYETGAFTGARKQGKAGLFEMAHGGTMFLDEIGELPLSQQVKLLQVIQERRITRIGSTRPKNINVRIIAATNRNLADMVKEGRFRADLFYRLNVVPIKIPPLRDRRDDIIPLMYFFLDRFNERYQKNCKVSKEVKELFLNYEWPGNVRELENMMERLVVIAQRDIIEVEDLPPVFRRDRDVSQTIIVKGLMPLREALEEVEKQLILQAKELYNSTYKMAEALKVNQSTVVRKLKKYE